MKKIMSVLLAILVLVSMSSVTVYAADTEKLTPEETNAKIEKSVATLEKNYGITISYPLNSAGNAMITMNNLETLDLALSTMTSDMVRQISKYYENRNGRKIDIEYYFSNSSYNYNGGVLMAAFEQNTSKVYIFLPSKAGSAIISGENPIALVHEMGHAFHLMCMDIYGTQKMYDEWTKFNDRYYYVKTSLQNNPDDNIFISGYARSSFEEDFAETFGHTFIRTNAGTGFRNQLSNDGNKTGLGKKVSYIEKLISTYISNSSKAVENFRKVYDAPTTLLFEGVTFSGEYMQYIGYPQPKNILKGLLNGLEIESQKSTWVRTIGAWRVIDTDGNMYYLFPGGTWVSALKKQKAA